MTERIVVLGSKGMLGQVAVRFFGKNHEVIIFNDRYVPSSRLKYIDDLIKLKPSVIINCIGIITPSEISKYKNEILSLSKKYDDLIIEYLKKIIPVNILILVLV